MKKYVWWILVIIIVLAIIGGYIYRRVNDPFRETQKILTRDTLDWYYKHWSITESDVGQFRPKKEQDWLAKNLKIAWGLPSELIFDYEEVEFHDISYDELVFKHMIFFRYPQDGPVVVTETYFCDFKAKIPVPLKRTILDTRRTGRKVSYEFLWNGNFQTYMKYNFDLDIKGTVQQQESLGKR